MKNIFGDNNQSTVNNYDGEAFCIRKVNEEISKKQEENNKIFIEYQTQYLSGFLNAIKYLCYVVALIFFCLGLSYLLIKKIENKEMSVIMFLFACGFLIIGIIVRLAIGRKQEKIVSKKDFKQAMEEDERLEKVAKTNLKVPNTAKEIDIFIYSYKIKNGKEKQISSKVDYFNFDFSAFIEKNCLCLADLNKVFAIPLSCCKKIIKIDKRVKFLGWTKEASFKDKKFSQYQINENKYGVMSMYSYYSLQIDSEGQEFEILFPSYELEEILSLTRLTVE